MARYLIVRLSAIGDVAMTIPVLYAVAKAYPQHSFTLLTQPFLTSLLINPPNNLEGMGIDIKHEESSLVGLLTYIGRLKDEQFDYVIDLHNVIRSKIIRFYLRFFGVKGFSLKKPRIQLRQLTAKPPKKPTRLPSVIERYAQVFHKAGLEIHPPYSILLNDSGHISTELPIVEIGSGHHLIGIAPFAGHEAKTYPPEKMHEVVRTLAERDDVQIFLFGGKGKEKNILEQWADESPRIVSVAGLLSLPEELSLIHALRCMVSMDSANMHFASLVGTRVISIWCATHPAAGFLGYGQRIEDCIGADLDCRPCSVFGNKPCFRKDYACRTQIEPQLIINKIVSTLTDLNSDETEN